MSDIPNDLSGCLGETEEKVDFDDFVSKIQPILDRLFSTDREVRDLREEHDKERAESREREHLLYTEMRQLTQQLAEANAQLRAIRGIVSSK